MNEPLKGSFYRKPVTTQEIINIVNKNSSQTSMYYLDVSFKLIKETIAYTALPLTHIINISFQSGIFPDEKLFNKRLDTFLEANQVITSSRYGFRNKASTSHALLDLHVQLTKSMDEKLETIGIFIDLKKAFVTIEHSLLIKKLNIYGIRGVASSWITSYLDKRSQYVYYNDVKSDTLDISCGVPQGSILGQKLFILYINDMVNVSKLLKFIIFADDTNLFCSNRDIVYLSIMVCQEVSKLETWFALNKLSLNVSRTNLIIFSNFKTNHDIHLFLGRNEISRVSESTFLGVIIDDNLNWHSHTNEVCSYTKDILL